MGITIHYEGHLRDAGSYLKLIDMCSIAAAGHGWRVEPVDLAFKKIERVIKEEVHFYDGPLRGITIYPHSDCEPVSFVFDSELFCQDYTKTQFAGPTIHRQIVRLLRQLESLFLDLSVNDESGYWDTPDEGMLVASFNQSSQAIEETLHTKSGGQSPVKTSLGRFIDIIFRR